MEMEFQYGIEIEFGKWNGNRIWNFVNGMEMEFQKLNLVNGILEMEWN